MVKIALPPRGYIARDLVISSLYELGEFEIKGDIAEVEEDRDKLKEIITKFRQDKVAVGLVNSFTRNYGKVVSYILKKDLDSVVDEFFKEGEEDFSYRLVLPEFMEAERWYGGWNGKEIKGKTKKKTTVMISMQSAILATVAFSLFRVFNYDEHVGKKKIIHVVGLAPVDSALQYQECRNLISGQRIPTQAGGKRILLDKLSQLGRIFLFAMYYSDNVCQKLIVMRVSQRADVVEDVSYSFIKPLVDVWDNVNSKNKHYRDDLTLLLTNEDLVEVFNRIANYVFEATSGVISPEQMEYFIAKDTYLKEEDLGFITPKIGKALREAVENVSRRGTYSA